MDFFTWEFLRHLDEEMLRVHGLQIIYYAFNSEGPAVDGLASLALRVSKKWSTVSASLPSLNSATEALKMISKWRSESKSSSVSDFQLTMHPSAVNISVPVSIWLGMLLDNKDDLDVLFGTIVVFGSSIEAFGRTMYVRRKEKAKERKSDKARSKKGRNEILVELSEVAAKITRLKALRNDNRVRVIEEIFGCVSAEISQSRYPT